MTERYSTFTLKIKALSNLSTIETYTNAPIWSVRGSQELNATGSGTFQFYASQLDLLGDIQTNIGQVVTIYATDAVASSTKMDLATFIIKKIETATDTGVSIVTVSGPGLTDQLRNTNAGDSAIDNGSGGVSTTDITDIMAFASAGWTLTNATATAAGTYHASKGDTVLSLLNAAAQQSGEIFRLTSYVDPSSKGLYWTASPDSSGVTLRMPTSYNQYDGSTTVGKLYSLRREFDFEPVLTRIRPYGAGVGDGRLDITGISSANTGADPAWLDTTFASNLMVNATLEASLGYVIEQDVDFSWIQASDPTNATQLATAATAVWKTGKNLLEQNDSERKFYTAVCNVAANLRPGQNVTIVYAEYEGGSTGGSATINDNLALTILGVENTFEGGERITTLKLGDKPLPQPTAAGWVADVAEKTQATTRKTDVGTSPGSVSTGRTINTTQPLRIDGGAAADLSANRTLTVNGLTTVGSANQVPGTNAAGTAWEYKTVTAGTGITVGHTAGAITITNSSPGSALAGLAYVTIGNTSSLSAERALTAGDGLDLTDGGANGTVTLAVDVTDILGDGLTESSNDIVLGTPSTLTVSTTNGVTTSSHTHAITTSSNPGAAAAILASTSAGYLTLVRFQANGAAGTARDFALQTAGVDRWLMRANNTAESGSNAGSDFQLIARSDAGAALVTAMQVTRATGYVNFPGTAVQATALGIGIGPSVPIHIYSATEEMIRLDSPSGGPFLTMYSGGSRQAYFRSNAGNIIIASEQGGILLRTGTGGSSSQVVSIDSAGDVALTGSLTISTNGNQGDRFLMTNSNVSGGILFYDFNQADRDGGSTGALEMGFYRDANNITEIRLSKETFEVIVRDGGTYTFPLTVDGTRVIMEELVGKTSDPGNPGELYHTSGTVKVSL
ncbi:hypothetical protein KC887_01165 [Candidatus Kaiserbacteria bacterium]|nr:hypothetical protein [Candidatus Kaiserbacteria bacterium]